ncbi:conidial hydrophobin Hyp1/RodA [Penicillium longicatenatum]|uniref:conidial hydrophobin Hyp1/RodA n=1 Tax=Penicillium longicatenatum TaxID=1561947 RepID=UPI0025467D58|nr:conidial hydrophobin Hyp1/RodA [Penicillium longicatenatum]KAJ5648822.1 conidial hydrophobin Hyp1/RodA [Penicillium longicatenatum]
MKFFATALLLAATAMALPQPGGEGNIQSIPKDMTINQAQAKCGDNAKVNCCNKYTTNKNINTNNSGPLAGVAQSALAQGLGIGEQCNDLSLNVPVLNIVGGGVDQLINQKCKQNIACCQNTGSNANNDVVGVALPCIALGSLL